MSEERWDMHTKVPLPTEKLQVMQQNLGNSEKEVALCKTVYSMYCFQDAFFMQHMTYS